MGGGLFSSVKLKLYFILLYICVDITKSVVPSNHFSFTDITFAGEGGARLKELIFCMLSSGSHEYHVPY